MTAAAARPDAALRERIAAVRFWYHTIELAPGIETPGWFDTRATLEHVPMPASLAGRRCLDVGTYDGFWAFEMERRGAAEVVAVDVLDPSRWDWPRDSEATTIAEMQERKRGNPGFELAREQLGSHVRLEDRSIYELAPDDLGRFDFVYVGSLLLHLRDPVRGVERVRSVCSGEALFVDAVEPRLERRHPVASFDGRGRPWWWKPNTAGLAALVHAGGFEVVEGPIQFGLRQGRGVPAVSLRPRTVASRGGREALRTARRGDPHAAVRARPA